jgi:hypothetical protein
MRVARAMEPGNDMTQSASMQGEAGVRDQDRDLGGGSEVPE